MLIEHEVLQHQWYVVAESIQLGKEPVAVRLLGRDYVVWRAPDGGAVAAPDRCPHREAPLSAGWVDDGCLVCPYHGWSFGDGGRCTEVPSSGPDRPVPPTAHLPTVRLEERYGLIWICPGEPQRELPVIPQEGDDTFRRINTGVEVWKTSATRMADNFMDISHFPWVHTATFGIDSLKQVPHLEMERLDDDFFGYQYDVEVGNDLGATASGQDGDVVSRHMSTGFHLPFLVRSTIEYETGLNHILLLVSTPIDDVTSYFTFVVWRNDDFSVSAEEIIAFDRAIGAEDKRMLELVQGVLPFDQQGTVSVQSDKASVEWRRQFVAMLG